MSGKRGDLGVRAKPAFKAGRSFTKTEATFLGGKSLGNSDVECGADPALGMMMACMEACTLKANRPASGKSGQFVPAQAQQGVRGIRGRKPGNVVLNGRAKLFAETRDDGLCP